MSDYVKPVKQCPDAPLGYQSVNELVESQDAQFELLSLEHEPLPEAPANSVFAGEIGGTFGGFANLIEPISGEHNTPKVARGSIGLEVDPNQFAIGAPIISLRYKTGVFTNYVRLGVGFYFFPVVGLTDFYGEALPIDTFSSSDLRCCQVTPTSTITISTSTTTIVAPGLYVSTWQETTLDSSNVGFDLADFSFDLVVYGNRDTDLTPPLVQPICSRAGVQRRRWHPRSRVVLPPI